MLGGDCCKPMALRTKENTITNRVKEVTAINMEGAKPNTVMMATI